MSPRLLRVLHWFGMTNLTDEEVKRYGELKSMKFPRPGDEVTVKYATGARETGRCTYSNEDDGAVEVHFPNGSAGMFPLRMVVHVKPGE